MKNSDDFINSLIEDNKYKIVNAKEYSDEELVDFLAEKIREINTNSTSIITLVGGVASGKSTLAQKLVKALGSADFITTDAFAAGTREYRHTQYGNIEKKYDLELYRNKIDEIVSMNDGDNVKLPIYDEKTGLAVVVGEDNFPKIVNKVKYFIVEGDFNFSKGEEDLSIYLHVPDSVRINNRLERDMKKRGWSDKDKLLEDIKKREENQHFPYTLKYASECDYLIVTRVYENTYYYAVYRSDR